METLIEINGMPKYLIEVSEFKEFDLNFEVHRVTDWNMKNVPIESEQFVRGVITCDGDIHLYFGEKDGYLFGTSYNLIKEIRLVLNAVWNKAKNEIIRFNKDAAYGK